MTICISNNTIVFGNYTLTGTPYGACFPGTISHQGLTDCTWYFGETSTAGYTAGGGGSGTFTPVKRQIDCTPFATDGNSSSVGNLTYVRGLAAAMSGETAGYLAGGASEPSPAGTVHPQFPPLSICSLTKFTWASETDAETGANLSQAGSCLGGLTSPSNCGYAIKSGCRHKFNFASDTGGTSVGEGFYNNSNLNRISPVFIQSITHGYVSAVATGPQVPGTCNQISKFPFASDTACMTCVGYDTAVPASKGFYAAQRLSDINGGFGYHAGGACGPPGGNVNCISRFPFASDTTASCVGTLCCTGGYGAAMSSATDGYASGGMTINPGPVQRSWIRKFNFSSPATSTCIGDLSQAGRAGASGWSNN